MPSSSWQRTDPTFQVRYDDETGQTVISGMGELHLEILVDRMKRASSRWDAAAVGRPQVAYREAITRPAKAEGRFVRQTGGRGQFGHCVLEVEPGEPGAGYVFENKIVGGAIPREFIPRSPEGRARGATDGHSRRVPRHRRQGRPRGRLVPCRRLVGDCLQDRRVHGDQGCAQARGPAVAGAGHWACRSLRRVSTWGDVLLADISSRRGKVKSMEGEGDTQCARGGDAARRDVRLCDRPAFGNPRARDVHYGIQPLREGAGEYPSAGRPVGVIGARGGARDG